MNTISYAGLLFNFQVWVVWQIVWQVYDIVLWFVHCTVTVALNVWCITVHASSNLCLLKYSQLFQVARHLPATKIVRQRELIMKPGKESGNFAHLSSGSRAIRNSTKLFNNSNTMQYCLGWIEAQLFQLNCLQYVTPVQRLLIIIN